MIRQEKQENTLHFEREMPEPFDEIDKVIELALHDLMPSSRRRSDWGSRAVGAGTLPAAASPDQGTLSR